MLLASSVHAASAHSLRARRQAPLAPPGLGGPPSPAAAALSAKFAVLDANKDGKVDITEFMHGMASGLVPAAMAAPGPAPGLFVGGPAAAPVVTAVAPAPAPAPSDPYADLPPHLRVPPPLPDNIPEPPPPPRAPPAEPAPPPLPPAEGQLVGPPPSEDSIEAAGNLTAMMASVPGLDLGGKNPLAAPNTPPPIPVPLPPPELPKVVKPMAPPLPLDASLMTPAPVAFGIDMARALPSRDTPLHAVPMPSMPKFLKPEPGRASLLGISSHGKPFKSAHV